MEPRQEPPAAPPPPAKEPFPITTATAAVKPDTGKRLIAKFIDFVVAAVLMWVVALIIPGWFTGYALGSLVAAAYLVVSDGLDVEFMRRRSLGKKVMSLDVGRLDGAPMDLATSARRNWMFTLGYFAQALTTGYGSWGLATLLSLAGLALVLYETYRVVTDPAGRRWGDELAGTQVTEV